MVESRQVGIDNEKVMYTDYILYSKKINKYYVGFTTDIKKRLAKHKEGTTFFTKRARDWKIVYFEEFESKKEAIVRERKIKKLKSRKYIELLVENKLRR